MLLARLNFHEELFYIFSLIKIIVLLISKPIFADPVNAWEIASPTVVSVLPTWPGYDKPGFGAPLGQRQKVLEL